LDWAQKSLSIRTWVLDPPRINIRFLNLIEGIYKKTGKQVVVLVDEYDKPLLESMGDETLNAKLLPFASASRRLVKAGVVFDTEKRTLGEWGVRSTEGPQHRGCGAGLRNL
jgi:hypothetical protein